MRAARRARELLRTDRQMPAVATAVARSVRSGLGLAEALSEAAATVAVPGSLLAEDLAAVAASVRRGRSLDEALVRWGAARPEPAVQLFVAACRFGHTEGGDLAAALEGAAVSLLDQVEVADEARALTSQARSSAVVLGALPVLGAVGFSVLDPAVARTLFTTGAGLVCLVVGSAFEVAGAMVLTHLVRRALR